jgi:hypothetical protein
MDLRDTLFIETNFLPDPKLDQSGTIPPVSRAVTVVTAEGLWGERLREGI